MWTTPRPTASFPSTAALAATVTLLALALAGCTADPQPSVTGSETPEPSASAEPSATPSSSPSPSPVVVGGAADAEVVATVSLIGNLEAPWDIAWEPDGGMLVTLSDEGRILRYKDNTTEYFTGPGADWLAANVNPAGEGGLLGIALLPSDPSVVYVYMSRTNDNVVARMSLTGTQLGEAKVILQGIPHATSHDGGRIRFGPDGYLYVTTGDARDKPASQDTSTLNGKILRMVADGTDADGSPAPGNPFGNLVWTYGHRNVQGIGWTADGRMYESELGQNEYDELNLIEPGNNYGWPLVEAMIGAPAGTAPGATVKGVTYPLVYWRTSEASPSGLAVTNEAIYVGALRGQRVYRIPLTATGIGTPTVLLNNLGRIRLVSWGPDGNLYVMTSNTLRGELIAGPIDDRIVKVFIHQVDE